ncbi:hypothetical protein ABCR94_32295 [Streptomyces sp. 21So2-11]|uniref:hypothetical protein n=1 Tax=Streptomyces sp. 21So2-11 TaxID=3144408 RepID=UPI00321A7466
MREWIDPRYAEVVDSYRASKATAGPPAQKNRGWARTSYGDPFVIFIHPVNRTTYTLGR